MLASTEKRLGFIAASALTMASLLLMSQQQMTATGASAPIVQTLAETAMPHVQKIVMVFSNKHHIAID